MRPMLFPRPKEFNKHHASDRNLLVIWLWVDGLGTDRVLWLAAQYLVYGVQHLLLV